MCYQDNVGTTVTDSNLVAIGTVPSFLLNSCTTWTSLKESKLEKKNENETEQVVEMPFVLLW